MKQQDCRVPFSRYLPAVCLLCWALISAGSILLSTPAIDIPSGVIESTNPFHRQFQLLGGGCLVIALFLSATQLKRVLRRIANAHPFAYFLLWIIFALMSTMAFLRADIMEIMYVAFLFGAILASSAVWSSEKQIVHFFTKYLMLFMGAIILLAISMYGLPVNRWIGGIHPNFMGYILFVFSSMAIFNRSLSGYIAYILCFALVILISSRYAMLCMLIVLFATQFTEVRARLGPRIFLIALSATILAGLLSYSKLYDILSTIFLFDSAERGLGSGGSGRTDLIKASLQEIGGHILFGAGFRNRDGYLSAHNGYINLVNEVGIFVASMLIFVILYSLTQAFRQILHPNIGRARNGQAAVAPYIFLASVLAPVFQPQLISFGDAQGVSFILGLTYLITQPRHYSLSGDRIRTTKVGLGKGIAVPPITTFHR